MSVTFLSRLFFSVIQIILTSTVGHFVSLHVKLLFVLQCTFRAVVSGAVCGPGAIPHPFTSPPSTVSFSIFYFSP